MTGSGTDPIPGAGLNPGPGNPNACDHIPDADPAPSTTCVSIDGRPFVPASDGPFAIGEGIHEARAFAVDRAGRHSRMVTKIVKVDRSDPVSRVRAFARYPAALGWWRHLPLMHLAAADGDQNAGIALIEQRLDSNAWEEYKAGFTVPEGNHEVSVRATDAAGRMGAIVRLPVPVDVTPAVVQATQPDPAIWLKIGNLLGPATAKLQWKITENLAKTVHVYVIVHDLTGNVVRALDGGIVNVTPGVTKQGFTNWDGKDLTLLGLVPLGIYYYRVAVVDEAGNWSHSGESKPIQIKLKLL